MDPVLGIRRTELGTLPLTFYCRYLACVTVYLSTLCMPPLRAAYTSLTVQVDLCVVLNYCATEVYGGMAVEIITLRAVKRPKCAYALEMRRQDENNRCPCQE
jgi:hypothetical protein